MAGTAYKTIAFAAALLTLTAAGAPAGTIIELRPGEAKTIDGLTVGFDAVVSDGRCPIGLLCFWEGDAACTLWAQAGDSDRADLRLHTSAYFDRSATYAGRTITLQSLNPYPVYERPTDPGDYVVTLDVSGSLLTPVEGATWSRIKALYR